MMLHDDDNLTDEERVYLVQSGQLPGSFASAEELGEIPLEPTDGRPLFDLDAWTETRSTVQVSKECACGYVYGLVDQKTDDDHRALGHAMAVQVYDTPSGKGLCSMCAEDVGPCEGEPCVNAGLVMVKRTELEQLRQQLKQARAAANAQRAINDALGAGELERLRVESETTERLAWKFAQELDESRAEIVEAKAEIERLRVAMQQVYEDGISRPGISHAALVEPLWRALQG